MLSREDSLRLAELERQLRLDDPDFCARMEGARSSAGSHRRRFPITFIVIAAILLVAAVVFGVLRWWVPASIAALSATVVVALTLIRAIRLAKS